MTFTKFPAVKKFVAVKPKYATIEDLAEDDREHAEVAGLDIAESPLPEARALLGIVSPGQPDPRRDDLGVGAHDTTSGAVSAMPDTLVGIPAVIAWTTSCCVVVARS